MNKSINSFEGGMNQAVDYSLVGDGEYPLLVNGRVRDGNVSPQKKAMLLGVNDGLPLGINMQGVYSLAQFSLVFLDGKAYVRDYGISGSKFQQVVGFQMDANVDFIYAVAVPSSKTNFQRAQADATSVTGGVNLRNAVTQQSACILCQDGINQPLVISFDKAVRATKNYAGWTVDAPEYVPIGKQMVWKDPILYLVSTNGLQVYRSISGRPLDFMVIVDINGNKLATEQLGGTSVVSHSISAAAVVSIQDMQSTDGSLYASTGFASYFVIPDFTTTFFGEPTFTNQYKADSGALNQQSFSMEIGDQLYTSRNGIRSFNAAVISPESGKNLPFSKKVWKLFGDDKNPIEQDVTAMCRFNDYTFAALKTIFGYRVLVHDELKSQWIALDNWTNGVAIKMFSEVNVAGIRKLLFITVDGKCYEAFASEEYEVTELYIGDYLSLFTEKGKPEVTRAYHKPDQLCITMTGVLQPGIVSATSYVDGKEGNTEFQYVPQDENIVKDSVEPIPNKTVKKVRGVTFNFLEQALQGKQLGFFIRWNFLASLLDCLVRSTDQVQQTSNDQRVAGHQAMASGLPRLMAINLTNISPTQNVVITGVNLDKVTSVNLGIVSCQIIAQSQTSLTFVVPVLIDGDYTLFVNSDSNSIEWQNTLVLTQLA